MWLRLEGAVCPLILTLVVMLVGCHEEYDFEHKPPERGTLGEEVWRALRKDAALSPRDYQARTALVDRERTQIILALDSMIPEALVGPLSDFLLAIRHLHDNNLLPGMTRKVAIVMDDVDTTGLLRDAWAADNISHLLDYKAPSTHSGFVEYAVGFPELKNLNLLLTRLFLGNDGVTDSGSFDPNEPEFMTELVRVVSRTLTTQTVEGDPERVGVQLGGVLLRSDPIFRPEGAGVPLTVTKLDIRGLPEVRTDPEGRLYSPFVDQDGDGLADVDVSGAFVDGAGRALAIVPFGTPNESGLVVRDGLGRAVAPDGNGFVFDYVDLHETAASYLVQQNAQLVEQDVIFDLADAFQIVLPARQTLTDPDTGESYSGYPANQPLMHLIYGGVQVLDQEGLDELLDTSATLLRDSPEVVAELLLSLEEFGDLGDMHPDAELEDDNTLADDLAPVLAEVGRKQGLVRDVLRSMRDPIALYNEPALLDMLNHKGDRAVPTPGGAYNRCFSACEESSDQGTAARIECVRACPSDEILISPMDFDSPRSVQNRSHFERLLNMVRATNGVQFEMLVNRLEIPAIGTDIELGSDILPPLLRIDNAAVAFFEAVVGNFRFEDFVTDEAIDHEEVALLLDGMDLICGTSFFGRLIERIIPILINVTEDDLARTCGRFETISDQGGLSDRDRKRKQIAVLVAFLSLLTDVAMDEAPTAAQLTRFFNTQSPSVDLEILSLSLSELVDQDGYRLWESDGDMLFASEATGTLDAMYPMIKAFSDHGATVLMADLLSVLSLHYVTPDVTYPAADGTPTPRAGRGTGIQRYEALIRDWLLIGRLFPALHSLALANVDVVSHRGHSVDDILEVAVRHIFVPDPGLTHFDGSTSSTRADGEVVEPISRFYILADALEAVSDRVDSNPQAREKWDRATDAAVDLLIGVEKDPGGAAVYKNPGSIVLTRFITEHLASRATLHRDRGTLDRFIEDDILDESEQLLTGRGLPPAVDLLNAVNSNPEDRALFKRFLLYSTADPVGAGHMLVKLYELLLDLTDETSFTTTSRFYGSLLDPDRDFGTTTSPLPLVSHGMLLLRENMAADEEDVVLQILRHAATRHPDLVALDGDPAGAMPLSVLGALIKWYHRSEPEDFGPLSAADYQLIGSETRDWMLDEQIGLEQLYDLVKARKKD